MSINKLGDMVVSITGENTQFDKSIDNTKTKVDALVKSAEKLGGKLSLFVTAPLLAAGVAAVKSSANMEMLQASFEVMLGSAQKATNLMAELKDLAAKTPFEVTGLAEASKTLLQFGIENEKVIPTLKQLGDISGGNSAKLQSLALVFGQIQSTGRLMGQDLLQLINAGFNPLQVISEKTGKSMAALKDEMSKGGISASQVAEAFKIATSEGGRFFRGMEVASKTFEGLTSTLKDDIGALARSFTDDLLPILKEMVKGLSSVAQSLSKLSPETKQTILIFAGFTAVLGPAILGVTKLNSILGILNGTLAVNPIVAVTTALVALGAITVSVANSIKNAQKNTEDLNNILAGGTTGDYQKDLDLINKELDTLNIELVQSKAIYEDGNPVIVEQIGLLKKAKLETQLRLQGQRTGRNIQEDQNKLDADSAALAEKKLKIEKQYKDNRELVLKTLEDEKSEYQKIQDQIDQLAKTPWAKGELEDARLKALQVLRDKQLAIINEASARLKAGEEANTAVINAEAGKRALALAQQESARLAKIQEFNNLSKSSTDLQIEQIEKEKQAFIDAGVDEVEAAEWASDEIINIRLDQFTQVLGATEGFVSSLQSLYQMDSQNRLDAIDAQLSADLAANDAALQDALKKAGVADLTATEQAQKELDTLKKKLDAAATLEDKAAIEDQIREAEKALTKSKIEEEYYKKQEQLEKDAALATYKVEKEAFEVNKKFSIVQTLIDTAELAVKAYKALAGIPFVGPGLGIAAAAAAAAFGAAKINLIKEQVGPEPPQLADGGIVMPRTGGVNTIMAEAGVPEVAVPLDRLGEVLNNFNINRDNSLNEIPVQFTFQMDSQTVFSKLFMATKNRTVLISSGAVV